jgi:hypothetical protein
MRGVFGSGSLSDLLCILLGSLLESRSVFDLSIVLVNRMVESVAYVLGACVVTNPTCRSARP